LLKMVKNGARRIFSYTLMMPYGKLSIEHHMESI